MAVTEQIKPPPPAMVPINTGPEPVLIKNVPMYPYSIPICKYAQSSRDPRPPHFILPSHENNVQLEQMNHNLESNSSVASLKTNEVMVGGQLKEIL